jgi:hypothetical protein
MTKIGHGHRVLYRRVLRHPGAAEVLFQSFQKKWKINKSENGPLEKGSLKAVLLLRS